MPRYFKYTISKYPIFYGVLIVVFYKCQPTKRVPAVICKQYLAQLETNRVLDSVDIVFIEPYFFQESARVGISDSIAVYCDSDLFYAGKVVHLYHYNKAIQQNYYRIYNAQKAKYTTIRIYNYNRGSWIEKRIFMGWQTTIFYYNAAQPFLEGTNEGVNELNNLKCLFEKYKPEHKKIRPIR